SGKWKLVVTCQQLVMSIFVTQSNRSRCCFQRFKAGRLPISRYIATVQRECLVCDAVVTGTRLTLHTLNVLGRSSHSAENRVRLTQAQSGILARNPFPCPQNPPRFAFRGGSTPPPGTLLKPPPSEIGLVGSPVRNN